MATSAKALAFVSNASLVTEFIKTWNEGQDLDSVLATLQKQHSDLDKVTMLEVKKLIKDHANVTFKKYGANKKTELSAEQEKQVRELHAKYNAATSKKTFMEENGLTQGKMITFASHCKKLGLTLKAFRVKTDLSAVRDALQKAGLTIKTKTETAETTEESSGESVVESEVKTEE